MPQPPQHFPVKLKFAGVDLRSAVDQLGPGRFRAAVNVKPTIEGALQTREGTVQAGTTGTAYPITSLAYLNDPVNSRNILLALANGGIYNPATASLLDVGYGADPFTTVNYRATGTSAAFAIIASVTRMSKFDSTGNRTQLGITPPGFANSTPIQTYTPFPNFVMIEQFNNNSSGYFSYPVGIGNNSVAASFANGVTAKNTLALQIQTASPLPSGYGDVTRVVPLNLTSINGTPSTDGDYFHLWFNVDNPASIQEVRLQFDVDPNSITMGAFNSNSFTQNFYWASISGAALQQIINNTQTTLATRAAALAAAQTSVAPFPTGYTPTVSPVQSDQTFATQVYPGLIQWTELKIPRSQFTRAGSDSSLGWATVQGFSITIIPTQYTQPVITLNDLYYYGSYPPDSTYGDFGYDYRMTYKSSATLSESNGGTIQLGAAGSDNLGLGPDYSGTSLASVVPINGGNGYVPSDVLNIGGGNNGQVVVVVAPGGKVETVQIYSAGYNYTVTPTANTTGGSGNGCVVAIPEIGYGLPVQRNPVIFSGPPLSTDPQVDTQCFYRRGGVLEDDWRLVAQQTNLAAANPVTAANQNGNTCFLTTQYPHQFLLGQGVEVASVWDTPSNPYVIVTAVGNNTSSNVFQYQVQSSQGNFTPGGQVTAIDMLSDTDIASASTVPQTNDVPVTTIAANGTTVYAQPLPFIWGPFNGTTLFGCGDPNRPGFVYWCNPGNPDGWSSIQNVEVTQPSDPLQNGFFWGGSPWVFSQNKLYQLVPAQVGVGQYQPVLTACNNGLYCRWGLAAGPDTPAVWYVASDGIYEIEPGSTPTCITDDDLYPLFNGLTVEGNAPINWNVETAIRLAYFNEEVWFTFQDIFGAQQVWIYERSQSWVYDRPKRRWRQATYFFGPGCIYPQPQVPNVSTKSNYLLLGGFNGMVYAQDNGYPQQYTDAGTPFNCKILTGAYDFEDPQQWKEFHSIVLDFLANGASITPTALYNDENTSVALAAVTAGASRSQQDMSLSDTYARSFSYQLAWAAAVAVTINGFEIVWRPDELPVVHAEVPANAFDMPGYGHVYDGYIGLRSNSDVKVTVTTEDPNGYAPAVITIPSTAGARQRVYLQFSTNKSRNFRVSLDAVPVSSGGGGSPITFTSYPFRVYPEDSYINFMAWGAIQPAAIPLAFKA